MATKISNEMKRHLVKYIKKVDVAWTGWKVKERASVMEVHRQLTASRVSEWGYLQANTLGLTEMKKRSSEKETTKC